MRHLNERQKLFLRTIIKRDYYQALKIASYSNRHAYRILREPKAEEYLLSYFQDEVGKLNLTYSDILKERLALARDPDTPAKVREDILKDIGEIIKASEDVNSETTDIKRLPFLKPAQQLKQAETVEAKEVESE